MIEGEQDVEGLVLMVLKVFSESASKIRALQSLQDSDYELTSDEVRSMLLPHASIIWQMILDSDTTIDSSFTQWKKRQIERSTNVLRKNWNDYLADLFTDPEVLTIPALDTIRRTLLQHPGFLSDVELVGVHP